jgi:hypothetical protein
MPWESSRDDRLLHIDLRSGIRGTEWEGLLDEVVRQRDTIDRVIFLLPQEFELGDQAHMLSSLVDVLVGRGLEVERWYRS